MAKLQKKQEEDHSNDWLNTYADMVTLLLTFFVMLYASSSLDEQKWQAIYQAFQSHGKYVNEYVDSQHPTTDPGDGIVDDSPSTGSDGTMPQSFDKLYVFLSEYVETNDLADYVAVEKGASHIKIRFDDSIFFDPNSSELKAEGRDILRGICPALKSAEASIQRCTVSGHTAEGISPVNDWALSSGRAVSVINYLDFRAVLPSNKFWAQGCGPSVPIADNATEEGRAKNRRVEMLILQNDIDTNDPETLKDIWEHDYGVTSQDHDPDDHSDNTSSLLPDGSAEKIISAIESKFPEGSSVSGGYAGPSINGDYAGFMKSEDEAPADDAADDSPPADGGGEGADVSE